MSINSEYSHDQAQGTRINEQGTMNKEQGQVEGKQTTSEKNMMSIQEIMQTQPIINVGMIGHVANGKSSIVKCLSQKETQKFSKEKERNITIRLGYANTKIWKCLICDPPQAYSASDSSCMENRCVHCNSDLDLVNHISIVDCFDPKTKALMFDGSAKEMSDLKCGELLMGPDGKSRKVLSMCEGEKNMYEIKYKRISKKSLDTNGFVCTGGHLLVLRIDTPIIFPVKHRDKYKISFFTVTDGVASMKTLLFSNFQDAQDYYKKQNKDPVVFEITVENYINLDSVFKLKMRLFYSHSLEFEEMKNIKELSILDASKDDIAWLIGLWLANGNSDGPKFKLGSNEQEIIDKINVICKKINLEAVIQKYKNKNAYWIIVSTQSGNNTYNNAKCNDNSKNPFTLLLKDLNLLNNKHINKDLMFQSVSVRHALLAGYIDGDGSYGKGQYEIVQSENHKNLIYGLLWICKSIGFTSHLSRKNTKLTIDGKNKEFLQYRLMLKGKASDLPIVSPQKKGENSERYWISSQPFDIIRMNKNKFIGFEIDNDGRFLLADFIVAHNCPGHNELTTTMLNGSSVMDYTILVEATNKENDKIPAAQTVEHLVATRAAKIPTALILLNKIDIVNKKIAQDNMLKIQTYVTDLFNKSFISLSKSSSVLPTSSPTSSDSLPLQVPIIPVSASLKINIDVLCHYLSNLKIPEARNYNASFKMIVIRSFDINKQGTDLTKLNGGVIGGTIIRGSLKVGDRINIYPGMVKKIPDNEKKKNGCDFRYDPIQGEVLSIHSETNDLKFAIPGGLLGIQLTIDPAFSRNDLLCGSMVLKQNDVDSLTEENQNKLFKVYDKIIVEMTEFIIEEQKVAETIKNLTVLMINVNSNNVDCRILKYSTKNNKNELFLFLDSPIVIDSKENNFVTILNKNTNKEIMGRGIIIDGVSCEKIL